jgi:Na+-driven multidrug efflux pump/anti-sigma regulatory factor (Ser/Thr protein kinase)
MIRKLFRQMLLTQILSSMTVMLCMLIDSIMIGRFLGVDSMTAYGLATPVLLVFAAMGSMISAGVQVMCGKTMGIGDKKGTNACFTASVVIASSVSVIGLIIVLGFTGPICTLLGAGADTPGNEVFRLTKDYLRGFIIGAPAFIFAQMMVPYMQISGSRTRLIVAVAVMTIADVVFDLINVLVIKGGTFGMGIASSMSYYIAFVIGIAYFFKKDCIFRFKAKLISLKSSATLIIDGVPTLINQVSLVFLTFVINNILLGLEGIDGNLAVAAYSVISTAGNICYSFSSGIASVALMLSSILYSDEDKTSLRSLVKTMVFYALTICSVVTVLVLIFASPLVRLFLDDPAAEHIAIKGMRIFVLSLVPCALNTSFKNYYQGVDHVGLTQTISVCQNFALTALSAYVLSRFISISGVWLGFLFGEVLTLCMITAVVSLKNRKVSFTAEAFSLLPADYGVREEDCLEMSITKETEVEEASLKASEFCLERGQGTKLSSLIGLSVDEMAENIVTYGFNKERRENSIDIRLMIKNNVPVLRIRDNCRHFDPVKYVELHRDDDPTAHIGIRMVMAFVKDANYTSSLGLNNLTLTF